ncbi:YcaO-like family protein [Streptococcus sp. H31]|uniref:YcaO-like family protein n=1 Tax=Streptococcus huangxiaojuni TaxID=3237239 RepID=UPI0034A5C92E
MKHTLSGIHHHLYTDKLLFKNEYLARISTDVAGSQGIGKSDQKIDAIRKAFGENFERKELFSWINVFKKSGTVTFFNGNLSFEQQSNFQLLAGDTNKDTSGVAMGSCSAMAVEHAFYEFIERQSFVYSFLTKSAGLRLNHLVREIGLDLLNRGEYFVNDISIVPDVSVVIFIYWTENHFSMGLGSHKNQYDAFIKAFGEASGFGGHLFPNSAKEEVSFAEFITGQNDTRNAYTDYFENHVSLKVLLQAYDYLKEGEYQENWKFSKEGFSIDDIFMASKHLHIPISLQKIETASEANFGRLVRVFSAEAYPSINNSEINPRKYNISYYKDQRQTFPNEGKYLPFP